MARPLRIEYEGALYHVTSRGTGKQDIYLEVDDRLRFLDCLALTVERFGWVVHAYVLMGNHYHGLVETPKPNLSRGIKHLNGVYAQGFNRRHRRWGHLFGHRYAAILVQRESHLLSVARYIVMNPVRAALCASAIDWRWSSARATAGLDSVPDFLTVEWLLAQFHSDGARARRAYREFLEAPSDERPLDDIVAGLYLGDTAFVRKHGGGRLVDGEISHAQRAPIPSSLNRLLAGDSAASMVRAYREHGYTLRELAVELGVHYSTVSRRLAVAEAALADGNGARRT